MEDMSTPILYGLVPIFVIFIVHYFANFLSAKSIRFRKILNGKPVIVISEFGIDYKALKSLNMNVHDLLESIRGQEYFSIEQISFAVVETNGKLSILNNSSAPSPETIPITLIIEGKFINANVAISNVTKEQVIKYLKGKNIGINDVVIMTKENDKLLVQTKNKKYYTEIAGSNL
jgi:uncharacterized membrane protein YcaP (DUF421 family)